MEFSTTILALIAIITATGLIWMVTQSQSVDAWHSQGWASKEDVWTTLSKSLVITPPKPSTNAKKLSHIALMSLFHHLSCLRSKRFFLSLSISIILSSILYYIISDLALKHLVNHRNLFVLYQMNILWLVLFLVIEMKIWLLQKR